MEEMTTIPIGVQRRISLGMARWSLMRIPPWGSVGHAAFALLDIACIHLLEFKYVGVDLPIITGVILWRSLCAKLPFSATHSFEFERPQVAPPSHRLDAVLPEDVYSRRLNLQPPETTTPSAMLSNLGNPRSAGDHYT